MSGSTVVVSVLADVKKFTSGFNDAAGGLSKFSGAFNAAGKVAIAASAVAVGAIAAIGVASFKAIAEIERLNAQTEAAIKSTGGAAGKSLEEIAKLADGLERLTGIEAESIQTGQNLLLTFTNIRGDQFDAATKAALDLSVAMGQDMSSAATLVGKALNDPIGGLSALSRVGIQFTDDQKAVIESLVEMGDVAGAQTVILEELNRQFGGSAEAFGGTFLGTVEKVKNAFGTLTEAFAQPFLAPATAALGGIAAALLTITDSPAFAELTDKLAGLFDGLDTSKLGDALLSSFESLAEFFTGGGASSILSQGAAIFGMLAEAGEAIRGPLGEALREVGTALQPLIPQLVEELTPALAELIPAASDLVIALLPLLPPLAELAAAILPALAAVLSDVTKFASSGEGGGFIQWLADFIGFLSTPTGDWLRDIASWFEGLGPVGGIIAGIVTQLASLFDGARHGGDVIANLVNLVVSTVQSVPAAIMGAFAGAGDWLVSSGQALIGGFVSGIESMLGRVGDAVGGVMNFVAGFFPSSPAKHGAFSGSGWTRISRGGGALASEFIGGFQRAANGFDTAFAGIASGIASSLDVSLTRPDFTPTAGTAAASEPTTVNNISVVQNNPVTRDPIKELRKASEDIMTGVWS